MFIGIIGHMGHGKTTQVGRYLEENGFGRVHPATPIRAMLRPFLRMFDFDENTIDRMLEGDLKRTPLPIAGLEHLTPTSLQQSLGTAWGRNEVHPEIWNMLVERQLPAYARVYNDSIRFPNEAGMVSRAKGFLIKVVRPGAPIDLSHESEQHIPKLPYHFLVQNDGDYNRTARQMSFILEQIWRYPYEEFTLHNPED